MNKNWRRTARKGKSHMVKHIVFWKLNEEAKKNNPQGLIEDLRGRFKALVGLVEGLSSIELGANYNGNEFDVALVCEFTSMEAEAAYQNHPAHLAIKERVHQAVCGRACVDYEY